MSHFIDGSSLPRPVRVVVAALTLFVLGCGEDAGPPTGPALSPESGTAAASLAFTQVAAGGSHTCGLDSRGAAFCWGGNAQGELGNGTTTPSTTPVPVSGGLRFRHLSLGGSHSCGLTTGGRIYCWGFNFDGQLGDGTGYPTNVRRLTPVKVVGAREYLQVRAGYNYTCAITTSYAAFCWGWYGFSTGQKSARPVKVPGDIKFRQLNAGRDHVCGVGRNDRAYCWGMNFWGQLGDGTTESRTAPVLVRGGLRFYQVTAGDGHSCGVTLERRAYCWGQDGGGDPDHLPITKPVAVATTLKFHHVHGGEDHTCGVTPAERVYCWGRNLEGEVGDGTTTRRPNPVPVSGNIAVEQLSVFSHRNVLLGQDGRVYQWGVGQTTPVLVY